MIENNGFILVQNKDGKFEEYKEPYATIECKTEEDFKKLQEILNTGTYTIEQIADAITQADTELIAAMHYQDREMLIDVLRDYLG